MKRIKNKALTTRLMTVLGCILLTTSSYATWMYVCASSNGTTITDTCAVDSYGKTIGYCAKYSYTGSCGSCVPDSIYSWCSVVTSGCTTTYTPGTCAGGGVCAWGTPNPGTTSDGCK